MAPRWLFGETVSGLLGRDMPWEMIVDSRASQDHSMSSIPNLVMINIAMVLSHGPFKDGVPIKKNGGSFHGELLVITCHNQMVHTLIITHSCLSAYNTYLWNLCRQTLCHLVPKTLDKLGEGPRQVDAHATHLRPTGDHPWDVYQRKNNVLNCISKVSSLLIQSSSSSSS